MRRRTAPGVKLEQGSGMVAGPACCGGHDTGKAERGEVEFVHEGIDGAHRVIRGHVVVEAVGQQGDLVTIRASDEPHQRGVPSAGRLPRPLKKRRR